MLINKDPEFYIFEKSNSSCGNEQYIEKSKLISNINNSNKSLLENDRYILGVFIRIYKYKQG